jgi:hypothetical protein
MTQRAAEVGDIGLSALRTLSPLFAKPGNCHYEQPSIDRFGNSASHRRGGFDVD